MDTAIVKKRVAVVGGRNFDDKPRLYEVLTINRDRIKLVISGGAKGADTYAVEWATDFGIPYLVFPALWRDPITGEYDRGAGFRRNRRIVEQADVVIAFWDGASKGTANTIELAKQVNKTVKIIKFTPSDIPKHTLNIDLKTGQSVVAHEMEHAHKQDLEHGFEVAQLRDKREAEMPDPDVL